MTFTDGAPIDVLVLGGGIAGVATFLSVGEHGGRAMLLERQDELGGSTVRSTGRMAFAGTDEQAQEGIVDDVDLLKKDLLRAGHDENVVELVDAYCADQLDGYRWLKAHGVVFGKPEKVAGLSVVRVLPIDTSLAIRELSRAGKALGGQIETGVRAIRLLMDGPRVRGVVTEGDGGPTEVEAGAVVIATGGFTRNDDLLRRFAPTLLHTRREGGLGNTGDGLLMGCKVGAGLRDMSALKGTFGSFPWQRGRGEEFRLTAIYKGAIAVNGHGERFANESLSYKDLGEACLKQPEGLAYQIFDAQVYAQRDPASSSHYYERGVEGGEVVVADTLAALADKLGIDPHALQATVAAYNQAIAEGRPDPQGRTTIAGAAGGTLFPLDQPPYYGFPTGVALLSTYAGLAIDARARVLDVFDEPIPGLYAAGEVTGGFHGDGYLSATSIAKGAVFGRIAGESAAAFARSLTT